MMYFIISSTVNLGGLLLLLLLLLLSSNAESPDNELIESVVEIVGRTGDDDRCRFPAGPEEQEGTPPTTLSFTDVATTAFRFFTVSQGITQATILVTFIFKFVSHFFFFFVSSSSS
jgi:hypothetical protein